MQECSEHSLIRLLFPWMQCQSLKPVVSQFSQTSLVTVDDFIALYSRSYIFYSHRCKVFIHEIMLFTLTDTILYQLGTSIFTVITEDWPCANWAVVTNNSTVIIKVVLIEAVLIERILYLLIMYSRKIFCQKINKISYQKRVFYFLGFIIINPLCS